jgi:hypothetical protein
MLILLKQLMHYLDSTHPHNPRFPQSSQYSLYLHTLELDRCMYGVVYDFRLHHS